MTTDAPPEEKPEPKGRPPRVTESMSPRRKCPGCGKDNLLAGGKHRFCKACRRKGTPEWPKEELIKEKEIGARIWEEIEKRMDRGDPDAELLEHLAWTWLDGKFPNGDKVDNETMRKDALKLLLERIGGEKGHENLEIGIVLDAKVTCSSCGKKVRADVSVKDEDVSEVEKLMRNHGGA